MKKKTTFGPGDKPEIHYPCQWQYKIIGTDRDLLEMAAREICSSMVVDISFSKTSSSAKYCSLNIELEVTDEEMRNQLFAAFKSHPAIKMVI